MIWALIFFVLSVVGWTVAFFGYLRPKFREFRHVMGVQPLLDMPDDASPLSLWQRVRLRVHGIGTVIFAFLASIVSGVTALLDALDPSMLASIKDTSVWQALGGENFALRAVSVITLFIAFVSIRAQVRAARHLPSTKA